MFCHAYFLWNDARPVAPMLEVVAILLNTKDEKAHRFECIGRGLPRILARRVRVLVLREATVSIRTSICEPGPRHVTVEGSEGSRQQRKEQERAQVSQVQPSERVRSKQEKLCKDEMRQHGERRSDRTGDWISVVARENSRDSGWNRFVCCSDCVRSFLLVRVETLQVLCGSECSKGERQVPCVNPRMAKTCEVLVAVSENDMSHDAFFPCCGEGT